MKSILRTIVSSLILLPALSYAAPGDTVIFTQQGHYYFTPASNLYSGYTPLIDRMGRPYVYLATKEDGLVTFDVSNPLNPQPALTTPNTFFGNIKVSAVAQDSNYLFVGLGDFESGETSGLAILNISNPLAPVLVDQWDSAVFDGGIAQVIWQGNYAYLAGMTKGVIILDISDKQNIRYVSNILPDTSFGTHAYTYHSRGLCLNHDTLLVADDNGGLRVIDVTNKQVPVETGKFISPNIEANGNHVFYNHVQRRGNYAYCTMDYCSWSVVDVSNPAAMNEVAWNNTWGAVNVFDWFGSPGHTNEVVYDTPHDVMIVSGTSTEVLAFDPSVPSQPRLIGTYGNPNDSIGSYGVDVFGNMVVAAIVHNPLNWPYNSIEGGIQVLSWDVLTGANEIATASGTLNLYPNPANDQCTIALPASSDEIFTVEVFDVLGNCVLRSTANPNLDVRKTTIDLSALAAGVYTVRVSGKQIVSSGRIVKQ